MTDAPEEVAKLAKLMNGIKIAMLSTVDADGNFNSRPMAQQEVEGDGDLWFFAETDSSAVAHIASNPHVGVTLSSASTWISIHGTAEVVNDPAKLHELWNAGVEAWLPEGPDDPNVRLIKVNADGAEYWDTPGGRVASAMSYIKSKATGKPYDGGENETVNL